MYPYFRMLATINENLNTLINTNIDRAPHENEELFYQLASELVRLLPCKFNYKYDGTIDYTKTALDKKTGVLLLSAEVPFLLQKYEHIIANVKCSKALSAITRIRNKYEHEPHNIRFAFSVGGNTSCSLSLTYKTEYLTISTIYLSNIILELNRIFDEVKGYCLKELEGCDKKYHDYHCYKFVTQLDLLEYSRRLTWFPWEYLTMEDIEAIEKIK